MNKKLELITIELEGRKIEVPKGVTVIEALWDTGHDVKRGIGCLSGLCGACTIAYMEEGGRRVKFGLGCQTLVQANMNVIMVPFFPSRRAVHDPPALAEPGERLAELYPELQNCNNCKSCNVCPEWIVVAKVMQDALQGDYAAVAKGMRGCIMCGLCASRCPHGIAPHFVGLFLQRAWGCSQSPPGNLVHRLTEQDNFQDESDWAQVQNKSGQELETLCRQIVQGCGKD
jgi:succinate dehydrogenase/fumarate reductase-like Fe-S protein